MSFNEPESPEEAAVLADYNTNLGVGNWSSRIENSQMLSCKEVKKGDDEYEACWQVVLAVELKNGLRRSDVGFGSAVGPSRSAANSDALRAALLDARQRVLTQFHGTSSAVITAAAVAASSSRSLGGSKPMSKPPTSSLSKGKIPSKLTSPRPSTGSKAPPTKAKASPTPKTTAPAAKVQEEEPEAEEEPEPEEEEAPEAEPEEEQAAEESASEAKASAAPKRAVGRGSAPTRAAGRGAATRSPAARGSSGGNKPAPATPTKKSAPTRAASSSPPSSRAPAKAASARPTPAAKPAPAPKPAGKVPLKTAKNIKDTQEQRDELLASIQEVLMLPVDVEADFDWPEVDAAANAASYNNRAGECMNTYLQNLRDNLTKHCKDEMIRDTISSQFTSGVIKLELVDKKVQSYCGAVLQDGELVMQVNKDSFWSNVGQMGDARFVASLQSDSGLSLKCSVNIKDTQEKRDEFLASIQEVLMLGVDVTADLDWAEVAAAADKAGYNDRAGECVNTYLQNLRDNLTKHCKDEMIRDTISSQFTSGVIKLELVDKKVQSYCGAVLQDGELVMQVNKDSFWSNVGQMGDARFVASLQSDSGLSLKCSVNIKDTQEKRDEFLASIQEVLMLGVDVTADLDWAEVAAAADKAGYNDRAGECVNTYLQNLRDNLTKHCKDEMIRDTISSQFTSGVIKLELVDKKVQSYCGAVLQDGELVMQVNKDSFWSNVGQMGDARFVASLQSDSGLSLKCSVNIKDTQEKRDEFLASIQEVLMLGVDVTADLDWAEVAAAADKAGYNDRAGECVNTYLQNLRDNLTKHCKDEMIRDTISSQFTSGVIKLELVDKKVQSYCGAVLQDGELVMQVNKDSFWSNVGQMGDARFVASLQSDSGLSLKCSVNIKDTQEKRDEFLASIQEVLMLGVDVTADLDWAEVAAAADKAGYNDRAGECVNTYLQNLRDNLTKHCKDEMIRDTISSQFTSGVIKLELVDKKVQSYCGAVLQDGELVMQVNKDSFWSNVGQMGDARFVASLQSDSGLSLKCSVNIKDTQEKRDEFLASIQEVLMLGVDVTADLDWAEVAAAADKAGYNDRAGECVNTYLQNLRDNLMKHCKDEMIRDTISSQFTSGVIKLELVDKKVQSYCGAVLQDGELVMQVNKDSFWSNVGQMGDARFVASLQSDSGLSLKCSVNIKDTQEKRDEFLASIQEVLMLGVDVTADLDWAEVAAAADKAGYNDRAGECVNTYLQNLRDNLTKHCKDEMIRDTISSQFTSGVIKLELVDKKVQSYCGAVLQDGELVMQVNKDSFWSNVGQMGDARFVASLQSDSGLSLKCSVNIKDTQEKRDEFLASIQEVLMLGVDVTADLDWAEVAAAADKAGYNDRAGECVNTYLQNLRDNLTKHCKDELVRDTISQCFTTGVIKLELVDKAVQSYCGAIVEGGELIMQVNKDSFWSNVGQMGDARMLDTLSVESAAAPDGSSGGSAGLPLKAAANVKEYAHFLEEHTKAIVDALGLLVDVTLDVDLVEFHDVVKTLGYENRVGEVVYSWILGGLKDNLLKLVAEDTGIAAEAVVQYWTTGLILLCFDAQLETYNASFFDNGDLIVALRPKDACSNVGTIGHELITQMLDTTNNLTVSASINLFHQEPDLQEKLARIADAVQLPVEPFADVDFVNLALACDEQGYVDRVGEVWGWILGGLADNIVSHSKDELVQGAIAEAWETGTIRLILDDNLQGYWSVDFLDGDLIITGKSSTVASNVGQVGNDIVDKL